MAHKSVNAASHYILKNSSPKRSMNGRKCDNGLIKLDPCVHKGGPMSSSNLLAQMESRSKKVVVDDMIRHVKSSNRLSAS